MLNKSVSTVQTEYGHAATVCLYQLSCGSLRRSHVWSPFLLHTSARNFAAARLMLTGTLSDAAVEVVSAQAAGIRIAAAIAARRTREAVSVSLTAGLPPAAALLLRLQRVE